ncbi:MAG: HDOD domain-containing protein [Desulfovibrionales bacterium]
MMTEHLPPKNILDAVLTAGTIRNLDPGSFLLREGTLDPTVHLILDGEFEMRRVYADQERVVGFLEQGEWVGEISFLKGIPRVYSVYASTPGKVVTLSRGAFKALPADVRVSIMHILSRIMPFRITHLIDIQEAIIDQRARRIFSLKLSPGSDDEQSTARVIRSIIDEMPKLPVYAGNLVSVLEDPNSSFDQIARIIHEDPSLAAQILKNVNSPYYGFKQKVVDLTHALTLLGVNQIYLLVLYHGLRSTMPNTPAFINLQRHSVVVSHVASALAELVDKKLVLIAGTLGLLHDIGKSVVLLAQQNHPQVHDLVPLLNQYHIGSLLLLRWNLPEEIHESIRLQAVAPFAPPADIPDRFQKLVIILTLAHIVADELQKKDSEGFLYWREYLKQGGFGDVSMQDLTRDQVIPLLQKKAAILPRVVRNLL